MLVSMSYSVLQPLALCGQDGEGGGGRGRTGRNLQGFRQMSLQTADI